MSDAGRITAAKHLLEAISVSKSFGEFHAVAGADLTVNEGDIIGLIGPNGAGKSTFFNCLAGETPPSGGRFSSSAPEWRSSTRRIRRRPRS